MLRPLTTHYLYSLHGVDKSLFTIARRSVVRAVALDRQETPEERERREAIFRKRKTEWKRRQRGQTFLDHLIVKVKAGKGGDGCVAFHREKFVAHGPPSGGNGGRGGDVYIIPTPHLTTLSSIPKIIKGRPGAHGQGSWMHGRNAPATVIEVPIGTVVRELQKDDPVATDVNAVGEPDENDGLTLSERVQKLREGRWVHYPGAEADNIERDAFHEAERMLYKQERDKRILDRALKPKPLYMDLDRELPPKKSLSTATNLEDGDQKPADQHGYLIASGGNGGYGNPTFLTLENRSPKFATRGTEGQQLILSLELKILADIGLVGFPNAGKSTLLRALTGGRAKTEVAEYAFTTLNPTVGVIRLDHDDNLLEGGDNSGLVIEDTRVENERLIQKMRTGEFADALTRNAKGDTSSPRVNRDGDEAFRFTISDNPGLISRASENVGLGHSFLRSIERSLALVYVVDLSGPSPEEELRVLRDELEKYKPGLSLKGRMVIANKADLLGGNDPVLVAEAKEKLLKLQNFVKAEMKVSVPIALEGCDDSQSNLGPEADGNVTLDVRNDLDVVPVSGKYSQNLRKVVRLLRTYIEEARSSTKTKVLDGQ